MASSRIKNIIIRRSCFDIAPADLFINHIFNKLLHLINGGGSNDIGFLILSQLVLYLI